MEGVTVSVDQHPLDGLPSTLPSSPLDPHVVLAHRQDTTYRAVTSLARYVYTRMEAIMATVAELQTNLTTLTATVNDYVSDVDARLASVQAAIDAAVARQTSAEALAASLQTELDAMKAGTDAIRDGMASLTSAVAAADAPIDRPANP